LNEGGGNYTVNNSNTNYASFYFPNEGSFQVLCQATNVCGIGSNAYINVYAGSKSSSNTGSNVYPNPVSGTLYIDIAPSAVSNVQITYDVRLYDSQGNLLRQTSTKGGTIEFNVTNLPDGIYYLHIYDEVKEKPEIQQILVEH